ncbi:VOC family protein [Deinococcus sp.]|uniref:VOC family protein n=1 Tax=Deinococcus sp. TaxID=47478 RepID=UPI003CC670DD
MPSPIIDLAGLTLEVNHLERGVRFYSDVLGLNLRRFDPDSGVAVLEVIPHQTLTLWQPITRQHNDPQLAVLGARGASHLHYAWQVAADDFEGCTARLDAHGVHWQRIELGTPERPDPGLYFFDPFGHGLEIRGVDLQDQRRPRLLPRRPSGKGHSLPIAGLREIALAFGDYPAMTRRLPRAYGFALASEQDDRNFAQFTLGPQPEQDGNGTPRRWLYAWDPQVGLAGMLGGDHALAHFYADVPEVRRSAGTEGLPLRELDGGRLAVRDPDGHVFVFQPLPPELEDPA